MRRYVGQTEFCNKYDKERPTWLERNPFGLLDQLRFAAVSIGRSRGSSNEPSLIRPLIAFGSLNAHNAHDERPLAGSFLAFSATRGGITPAKDTRRIQKGKDGGGGMARRGATGKRR